MYKLETHLHVAGTSPCAIADENEIARIYKEKGYNGVVYTSHYNSFLIGYYGMTAKSYNENFVEHYYRLKDRLSAVGIDTFFGMEFMPDCTSYYNEKTSDKAEFLIYGATLDFLFNGAEEFFYKKVEDISEFCKKNGWIFSQAHPFRRMISYREPSLLEAAEAYNGNARNDSRNDLAERYVTENGLIALAGSDFHEPVDGGAGVILENEVKTEKELVEELRKRRHTLITGNHPCV